MQLKPGQTLASSVDGTAVIVIRAPMDEVTMTCGGQEMIVGKPTVAGVHSGDGLQLGKRYVDDDDSVELLCTKPGGSPVEIGGNPVRLKEAKALPSSD